MKTTKNITHVIRLRGRELNRVLQGIGDDMSVHLSHWTCS